MKSLRLTDIKESFFEEAWNLYKLAFPLEEQRSFSTQKELLQKESYHFDVFMEDDGFLGFLLWWSFDEFRFVEHFALVPRARWMGFGKQILEDFLRKDVRSVLLEVDLPDNEICKRRIGFYQKLGFKLNQHFYQQPSLRKECDAVDLYLMSYPLEISEDFVVDFIAKYHPIIYG